MPIRNLDKYLDPPDEPEAQYCESCGKEMEIMDEFGEGGKYVKCVNPLCPDKFTGGAKALAEKIVELEEDNLTLQARINVLVNQLPETEHILFKKWKKK